MTIKREKIYDLSTFDILAIDKRGDVREIDGSLLYKIKNATLMTDQRWFGDGITSSLVEKYASVTPPIFE